MDYGEQYEQHLIEEAIKDIQAGGDRDGRVANFLRANAVCPHCFRDSIVEPRGVCADPQCDQYGVPHCSL